MKTRNLERTSQAFYSTFINLCQTSVNRTPTPSLCGDPVLKLFLELSRGDLPFVAVLTLLKKPTVSKNEESPKPYEHKRVILRSTTGAPGGIRTHDPLFRSSISFVLACTTWCHVRFKNPFNPYKSHCLGNLLQAASAIGMNSLNSENLDSFSSLSINATKSSVLLLIS